MAILLIAAPVFRRDVDANWRNFLPRQAMELALQHYNALNALQALESFSPGEVAQYEGAGQSRLTSRAVMRNWRCIIRRIAIAISSGSAGWQCHAPWIERNSVIEDEL